MGEAAGALVDRLGELHVVEPPGADLGEDRAEQVQVGQQLRGQARAVETEVEVADAVGRQIADQQRRTGQLYRLDRVQGRIRVQVTTRQAWQAAQVFGRGARLLKGQERPGVVHQVAPAGIVEGAGDGVEPFLLLALALFHLRRVRHQGDRGRGRVVEQVGADQPFEITARQRLLPDLGEQFVGAQGIEGRHPVAQGRQGLADQVQAALGLVHLLAHGKLVLVQFGEHQVPVQAGVGHAGEGRPEQGLEVLAFLRVRADQIGDEQRAVAGVVQEHAAEILAQVGVDDGLLERRAVGVEEDVGDDLEGGVQLAVPDRADQRTEGDEGPLRGGAARLDRVALLDEHRPGDRLALLDAGPLDRRRAGGQVAVLDEGQFAVERRVPVEEKGGVGRVVVRAVEGHELLVAEVRDARRVAARLVRIGRPGQQAAVGVMEQGADRVGEGALHLVEHHARELDRVVGVLQMVVPALLLEGRLEQQRVEHDVAVDVHDVEVFRQVAGGEGVPGGIRAGHGVEEGHEPALVDLAEHVLHRVFLRAHEHRVLENVGHAGGVLRHGHEGDAEGLVGVVVLDRQGLAAEHRVGEQVNGGVDFRDLFPAFEQEAVMDGAGGKGGHGDRGGLEVKRSCANREAWSQGPRLSSGHPSSPGKRRLPREGRAADRR